MTSGGLLQLPIAAAIPFMAGWGIAGRKKTELIDVRAREGVVGHAYLEPYVEKSVPYVVQAIEHLAGALQGKPLAPLDAYRDGLRTLHLVGRDGVSLIAISGLDMAIWDALAKAANLPLVTLLGGTPGPVRAYNTNGLWLIPLDRIEREAAELVAQGGFSAIKIRLGRERLADDLAVIAAVRRAVGDEVKLMCDFNQGLMPDLMRIGGVTGFMRSAAIAGAAGLPLSNHLYPMISTHLLRASETADWLEWSDWAEPVLAEPLPVKDGFAHVPAVPGTGIAWNEEAVKRLAL